MPVVLHVTFEALQQRKGLALSPALHCRERKRVQMIQLAARTRALEQENANLQFMLGLRDQEIGKLRSSLASFPRSARDAQPGAELRTQQTAAASPSEPAVLTGTGPCADDSLEAYAPAPQPASMLAPSSAPPDALPPGAAAAPVCIPPSDDRITPEAGNPSLPGMDIDKAVSFQGSSDPATAVREQLQLQSRGTLLIDGLPIELAERGMSTNHPGIIIGSDGQWLRLRQRSASSPCNSQPPPQTPTAAPTAPK